MWLSNYHMHSDYCDGKNKLKEYVKVALERGLKSIGFSSHAPIPNEDDWTMKQGRESEYFDEIHNLKHKYADKIQIYLGLEIDYLNNGYNQFNAYPLDYKLGAVHCYYDYNSDTIYAYDGPEKHYKYVLEEIFKGNVPSFVNSYYELLVEMMLKNKFDIIAHIDVIRKNNKGYFKTNETWYHKIIQKTLEVAAQKNLMLETNTGAISRGYNAGIYPEEWILHKSNKLDIPIVVNSDAHKVDDIIAYFDETIRILKNSGYTEHYVLDNGKWVPKKL